MRTTCKMAKNIGVIAYKVVQHGIIATAVWFNKTFGTKNASVFCYL